MRKNGPEFLKSSQDFERQSLPQKVYLMKNASSIKKNIINLVWFLESYSAITMKLLRSRFVKKKKSWKSTLFICQYFNWLPRSSAHILSWEKNLQFKRNGENNYRYPTTSSARKPWTNYYRLISLNFIEVLDDWIHYWRTF